MNSRSDISGIGRFDPRGRHGFDPGSRHGFDPGSRRGFGLGSRHGFGLGSRHGYEPGRTRKLGTRLGQGYDSRYNTTYRLPAHTFKHNTLHFIINFTGKVNKKNQPFTTRMIVPNEHNKKVYFSPVVKYSNDLFKEAKVPIALSTFTDHKVFRNW